MKRILQCIAAVSMLAKLTAAYSQTDSLVCDKPYLGRISVRGEFDLISFRVSANEIFSITITEGANSGLSFTPYWRIVDRNGSPATSCGSLTFNSPADCGPLDPVGNPNRIEVTDFLNDDVGDCRMLLQSLTSTNAREGIVLKCDVPHIGAIGDSVDSDLLGFNMLTNERARITVLENPSPIGFTPYWRILDRPGRPAASCGSRTFNSPVECGPFDPSGNPYRLETMEFSMIAKALTRQE